MVSPRDALVTILAVFVSLLQLLYVLFYPINILFATILPGFLLPIAYVIDRRRRSGPVGPQRGEERLVAVGVGSFVAWVAMFFFLPIVLFWFLAAALSCLSVVLTVAAWLRLARTP